MATAAQFARDLSIRFHPDVQWAEVQQRTAAFARSDRDARISAGTFPPRYQTWVNGLEGAREETIQPGGAIVYRALVLGQAVALAIEELWKNSPERTGTYLDSFVFSVARFAAPGNLIPARAFHPSKVSADATEAFVFNTQPYGRKLDVQIAAGRRLNVSVPAGFFSAAAASVRRAFPHLHAQRLSTVRWHGVQRTRAGRKVEYPAVWIGVKPH